MPAVPVQSAGEVPTMLRLPEPPAALTGAVKVWREPVEMLTYAPEVPDVQPMFLERRVYQGSSGRVYPLPFYDRISTKAEPRMWDAIHLENEFLRITILPEIGGRIHVGFDKRTGYDFFYRQNVIRPALVGLAGPWISGGVEFNWPQHHRPATFMPVETDIEEHPDGSVTVWCGDHDPMLRMKGMHGVSLQPGRAVLDVKVRLYNRTPYTQTFLWWANVATRVHERYQSFFPTDVRYVADHAKRAVTSFPLSNSKYYGVDYPGRAQEGVPAEESPRHFLSDGSYAANDLSWYANIPVPTSYMVTGTEQDFFGGYDHARGAGVVHVANHHIVPGKKQWTWGNHEFGYAWDRSLTLADGPYIELMAGAYTDNQPDFSFLAPWETKSFLQSWYPLQEIGVPQMANTEAALRLTVVGGRAAIGVQGTSAHASVTVILREGAEEVRRWELPLSPQAPLRLSEAVSPGSPPEAFAVEVLAGGRMLIAYDPAVVEPAKEPTAAKEPAAPEQIGTVEELYLTGLHLSQYRHATRHAELYWQEALRRDPQHSQTNNALGLWRLGRGEFGQAAEHFTTAVTRLTALNPNPRDGEPYYNLGITERLRGRAKEAYDALYKATWNAAWRAPAFFALAEMDCQRGDWAKAQDHLERCCLAETDHLNARSLMVFVLERLGRLEEARAVQASLRRLDRLEVHSRWREGVSPSDGQQVLDLVFDLQRSGQSEEAERALSTADLAARDGSVPMLLFTMARVAMALGKDPREALAKAVAAPLDYCFPCRLEEMCVLQETVAAEPEIGAAHYLLGNLYYDRRRYREAIGCWEKAAALGLEYATVWRNLGIARFNVEKDTAGALEAYERAFAADAGDARVLYERDQLWKRTGANAEVRLAEFEDHRDLVRLRDDLTVEYATLLNQAGRSDEALELLLQRRFQPWEGGEGLVLGQYTRSHLLLGRRALESLDAELALRHFCATLEPPESLSDARHLLANQSDIYYWLGVAHAAAGDQAEATRWWRRATRQRGDFQQMAVRTISSMTFWAGMAHVQLGERVEGQRIFEQILRYAEELERREPTIDYFATSLPAMLLFEDDLVLRNRVEALLLKAQAVYGLGRAAEARGLLDELLTLDPNHVDATDLMSRVASAAERIV